MLNTEGHKVPTVPTSQLNVCDKSTGYYTFTRLKHLNNAGRNIQQGNFL